MLIVPWSQIVPLTRAPSYHFGTQLGLFTPTSGSDSLAQIPDRPEPSPTNAAALTIPFRSNFAPGLVVPMPTLFPSSKTVPFTRAAPFHPGTLPTANISTSGSTSTATKAELSKPSSRSASIPSRGHSFRDPGSPETLRAEAPAWRNHRGMGAAPKACTGELPTALSGVPWRHGGRSSPDTPGGSRIRLRRPTPYRRPISAPTDWSLGGFLSPPVSLQHDLEEFRRSFCIRTRNRN